MLCFHRCLSVYRGVSVSFQGGLCAGGSLSRGSPSRGFSVWGSRVSVPGGLCLGGSLSRGSLFRGVSVWGSLSGGDSVQGVSVQRVSVWRDLCPGGFCHEDFPYGNEQAVRILLECILVQLLFPFLNVNFTFALGYCAHVHGTGSHRPRGKTYLSICTK